MFEDSFQYIGLLDLEGKVLEANRTALEATGVTREEVVGQAPSGRTRWWSVSEEAREQLRDGIARARRGDLVRFETLHRGRGDDVLTVDFSLKPVRDEEGRVVLLIPEGRDISELKRAQRAETAMLRSPGHDRRVGGDAGARDQEPDHRREPGAGAPWRGSWARTTRPCCATSLAACSASSAPCAARCPSRRRSSWRPGPCAWPSSSRRCSATCARSSSATASRSRPRCPTTSCLRADRQLLGEVLTNLLKNAREALQRGGRRAPRGPAECEQPPVPVRRRRRPGIPPEVADDLFRPFVTSKHAGTDWGLAFCRKVAEAHGGTIEVETSPLGGARFGLDLPLA